jgi:O-antigen ligase
MEIARQNTQYVPKVEIRNVLFVLSLVLPFFGVFVNYYGMWILMFALGFLWITLTKHEANAGLMFLWGLEFEPAPVDFVFFSSWLKRMIKGDVKWSDNPLFYLLFAYVLINLIQIPLGVSLQRSVFFAFVTIYTISLAYYFAGYIKDLDTWNEVKRFYMIAVMISAIVLIVMILLLFVQGRLGRPAGFFKDPNVAGAFMTTGALFAMTRILFGRKEEIVKYLLMFLFLLISVVLTFSRGSLLNLLSGIAVIGFISIFARRSKRFFIALSVAVIIGLISVPFLLETFRQSFRFRGLQWYDIYGRAMAWRAGVEMVKSYPLGVGPGQFEHYSVDYQKSIGGPMLRLTPSAHSLYLRVLTENGLFGFGIFLMALGVGVFAGIYEIFKSLKSDEAKFQDMCWIFSSLVGILVQSFVIDTLHWRHFWIILGFMFGIAKLKNKLN